MAAHIEERTEEDIWFRSRIEDNQYYAVCRRAERPCGDKMGKHMTRTGGVRKAVIVKDRMPQEFLKQFPENIKNCLILS